MLLPRVPLYSARAVTATSEPVSQAQLPSEIPDDVGCGSAHSADDAGSGGHNGPAGHTAQHGQVGPRDEQVGRGRVEHAGTKGEGCWVVPAVSVHAWVSCPWVLYW